jgi:hypothetical protein
LEAFTRSFPGNFFSLSIKKKKKKSLRQVYARNILVYPFWLSLDDLPQSGQVFASLSFSLVDLISNYCNWDFSTSWIIGGTSPSCMPSYKAYINTIETSDPQHCRSGENSI